MAEVNGFPRQYFTFFNQLANNNSKEMFPKSLLDRYRKAVVDKKQGQKDYG